MWTILLTMMIPPPSQATLAEYAVVAPTFPAEAVQHELANGEIVGIVSEKPKYETRNVTKMIPSCGMEWCVTHPRVPMVAGKEHRCTNAPTPLPALESILRLAGVTKDDCLYDLGCGDGRVCVMASKMFDIFTIGLDIRPEAVAIAQENARINGVDHLATFYAFPIKGQRLQHATVVYAYLTPETMQTLRIPENVRMGISYQHPWPGVRKEKIGAFYVWRRPEPTVRTPTKPAIRLCGS